MKKVFNLSKYAGRGNGTVQLHDPDYVDPYRRRGNIGDGSGDKLTTPGDSDPVGQHGGETGLGSRWRNDNAGAGPQNISAYDDLIEQDSKIPDESGKHMIDDPGIHPGSGVGNTFVSPIDQLHMTERDKEVGSIGDISSQQASHRVLNKRKESQDDDIFTRVQNHLRGK